MTLITLFTDAGYCPYNKIGSWAAWAKADGVAYRKSGLLRGTMDHSAMAELRALVNGVAFVLAAIKPPSGSKIIAQLDCQDAIAAMLGTGYRRPKARERVIHATEKMRQLVIEAGVTVEYRHVPGHAGVGTPRTAVNTWCDRECTQHLNAGRAAIRSAA